MHTYIHYITLHYITVHYITLHTYMHTYIHNPAHLQCLGNGASETHMFLYDYKILSLIM